MSKYVLDTNIVSHIVRGRKDATNRLKVILEANEDVIGCPVVWYEVRRGLIARDARKQMSRFELLFAQFDWQDLTQKDWSEAATFWSLRRKRGIPVTDADLLIAIFTLNRDAILVTDNVKDFVHLGVTTENWLV